MAGPKKYRDGLIRAVRLALEGDPPVAQSRVIWGFIPRRCASACAARRPIAARDKLLSSREREEIRRLRRENYQLRRANEILKSASVFSPRSSAQTDRGERVHRRAS